MQLSEYGKIVSACWDETPAHFARVEQDIFVVMPNHVHLIVILTDDDPSRGTACRAPTPMFGKPIPDSLPTIIRSFKSAATKRINTLRDTPGASVWQRNYYERIIRNERELDAVRRYIIDNPVTWNKDIENAKRVI